MLSLVVHKTIVFVQFEIVHEPILGSNIAKSMCFSDVVAVLLSDTPELIEWVGHSAFTENRGFTRASHDSAECLGIVPRVDER